MKTLTIVATALVIAMVALPGCKKGVSQKVKQATVERLNQSIQEQQYGQLESCVTKGTLEQMQKLHEKQMELARLEERVGGTDKGPEPEAEFDEGQFMETLGGRGMTYRVMEGDAGDRLECVVDGKVVKEMDARFVAMDDGALVDFTRDVQAEIEKLEDQIEARTAEMKQEEQEAIEEGRCDGYLVEAYVDVPDEDERVRFRGFISRVDGEMMIPLPFNDTHGFNNGLAIVDMPTPQGILQGLIDCKGEFILEPKYESLEVLHTDDHLIVSHQGPDDTTPCFYLDAKGERVGEAEYTECKAFNDDGVAQVIHEGEQKYIDDTGAFVDPPAEAQ